jgi:APA family basic amino acid/polyamine antiporter
MLRFAGGLFRTQPLDRIRPDHEGPPLRRVLRKPGLVAIGLGTMLGGIFTTIGAGTLVAGPGVIIAFLLSGLACVFVAFCYAELAAMVPIAGSAYTYAYATLGEVVAWVIGWDLILEYGISVAPVASSWSGYLQAYLQNFGVTIPAWAQTAHLALNSGSIDLAHTQVDVIAAAVVLVMAVLLAIGIKESSSTNTVLVVVQVFAIVIFIVALASAVRPANLHPLMPLGFHSVVTSAALVFFAYIGFDTVTVASEEAHLPARDVPFGIIVSLIIGAVLYIGIAYVTVGVVPWQHIDQNSGMADAVRHAGNNPLLATIVAIGALGGTTTVMLTSLLGQIRIFFVMARDRMLPPFIARVNARTQTPLLTTVTTGVIVAFLAAIVPLDLLLALVNIGTLSAFSIVCLGVLVLRFAEPERERPYRAPFGPVVAVLGLVLCLYLMVAGLSGATWLRFVIWFLVGIGIYAAYGYRKSSLRLSARRAP